MCRCRPPIRMHLFRYLSAGCSLQWLLYTLMQGCYPAQPVRTPCHGLRLCHSLSLLKILGSHNGSGLLGCHHLPVTSRHQRAYLNSRSGRLSIVLGIFTIGLRLSNHCHAPDGRSTSAASRVQQQNRLFVSPSRLNTQILRGRLE